MNIGTQIQTAGLQSFLQVTTVPGVLVSLLASNDNTVAQFIQLWDATSATDADAELVFAYPLAGSSARSLDTPVEFTRGIHVRVATALINTQAELAAGTNLGSLTFLTARYFTP